MAGCALALADPGHTVRVVDGDGEPLADAVVTLLPRDETVRENLAAAVEGEAVLAQRGHRFVPFVLAIPVGTRVHFPNFDDTRHHVYSFSEIRPFEIELYRGDPEVTIDFPQTGVAVVGCNIHDWMAGYIYVTDAPVFGVTDERGLVDLPFLPQGRQAVRAWHPWQEGEAEPWVGDGTAMAESGLTLSIDITPPPPRRPAENALQEWFQNP